MYYFSPKKKSEFFDKYFVEITPKTKRIHSILAVGPTEDNWDNCTMKQSLIIVLLEKIRRECKN